MPKLDPPVRQLLTDLARLQDGALPGYSGRSEMEAVLLVVKCRDTARHLLALYPENE